jgi:pimeloyl-ACP methyl ester carboxylesterase
MIERVAGDGVGLACAHWPAAGSDRTRRAPVLALHGITSSLMSFVGVAEALGGARPLHALDLRGHGQSDAGGPYTIEQHARDVAAAARARDLPASIVVGHSFGAYVAVELAARAPELVAALVLVDGGYPPLPPGVNGRAFADWAMAPSLTWIRQTHASDAAFLESWRAMPALAGTRRDWLDRFVAHDTGGAAGAVRSKVDEAAVIAAYYDMVDVGAIEERLARVTVPLTLVRAEWGAADALPPIVPDEVVAAVRRRVRHASVVTVAGANHYTIVLAERGAKVVAETLEVP